MAAARKVCLGVIVGAHGIRGEVRLKSFTARPADLAAYGDLTDESGARRFRLTVIGEARGALRARLSGVNDRNAAEALRGVRLYVDRESLPKTGPDEYYHADLIGLAVMSAGGEQLGRVTALYNHGAGDILEIERPDRPTTLVPFQKEFLNAIDPRQGVIVLSPAAAEFDEELSGGRTPGGATESA